MKRRRGLLILVLILCFLLPVLPTEAASQKMLSYLKRQQRRSKIPAGVPGGVVVANKTGETNNYTHDAAIVYSKNATYILVVMGSTPGSGWSSAGNITSLSRLAYNYLNP